MLSGTVFTAADGMRGFDIDDPLDHQSARAFARAGYQFVMRYVGRRRMAPRRDLTIIEAETILEAGLALGIVQHVEHEGWSPTTMLGAEYGMNAASFTRDLGVPRGVSVWCDLEGVAHGTPSANVIGYSNAWYDAVALGGYSPGLYVGDAPGLSATQLYRALRFRRYWGAYNVNADQEPRPRGWQMKQHVSRGGPIGPYASENYDDNMTHTDRFGGRVTLLALSLPPITE